ncbi:MAG: hypothetical protein P8X90_25470, partial [Desulfobacterales bacterium]
MPGIVPNELPRCLSQRSGDQATRGGGVVHLESGLRNWGRVAKLGFAKLGAQLGSGHGEPLTIRDLPPKTARPGFYIEMDPFLKSVWPISALI